MAYKLLYFVILATSFKLCLSESEEYFSYVPSSYPMGRKWVLKTPGDEFEEPGIARSFIPPPKIDVAKKPIESADILKNNREANQLIFDVEPAVAPAFSTPKPQENEIIVTPAHKCKHNGPKEDLPVIEISTPTVQSPKFESKPYVSLVSNVELLPTESPVEKPAYNYDPNQVDVSFKSKQLEKPRVMLMKSTPIVTKINSRIKYFNGLAKEQDEVTHNKPESQIVPQQRYPLQNYNLQELEKELSNILQQSPYPFALKGSTIYVHGPAIINQLRKKKSASNE